jgi:hypothetical protein
MFKQLIQDYAQRNSLTEIDFTGFEAQLHGAAASNSTVFWIKLFASHEIEWVTEGVSFRLGATIEPPFSFGIEFEGDVINANQDRQSRQLKHQTCAKGWSHQNDMSATFELRTPVFTNVKEACQSIKKEFTKWCIANPAHAPLFKGTGIGHHIHVGEPDTGPRGIGREKKILIVKKVIKILPFCYFISANNKSSDGKHLSTRMKTSSYCMNLNSRIIENAHRYEIEDSHVGTVELRKFDANIPQVSLAVAAILEKFVKFAQPVEINAEDRTEHRLLLSRQTIEFLKKYSQSKDKILRSDPMELLTYKQVLREIDIDFSKYPDSVKEVLYLALVKMANVCEAIGYHKFEFCREIAQNPEKLFEIIIKYSGPDIAEKIKAAQEEAKQFKTLRQMIDHKPTLEKNNLERLVKKIGATCLSKRTKEFLGNFTYDKKDLKEIFKVNKESKKVLKDHPAANFLRLRQIRGRTPTQIALDIAAVTGETAQQVRESIDRYYVQYIKKNLAVIFSINIQTMEPKKFFIDEKQKGFYEEPVKEFVAGILGETRASTITFNYFKILNMSQEGS